MKPSKAQRDATYRYEQKAYDRILVRLPKGMKDKIEAAAAQTGESINAYIRRAIAESLPKVDILDYQNRYALYDAINEVHFGGALPRPEISIEMMDERYEHAVGEYLLAREVSGISFPATIVIPRNPERLENNADFNYRTIVEEYASLMAHEMIHHYCAINGIRDYDDETGRHTLDFAITAKQFGLLDKTWQGAYLVETSDGWALSPSAEMLGADPCNLCIGVPDIDLSTYVIHD